MAGKILSLRGWLESFNVIATTRAYCSGQCLTAVPQLGMSLIDCHDLLNLLLSTISTHSCQFILPLYASRSLGNEAGRGRNLVKARRLIQKQLDTTRPICYESGGAFFEGVGRTELTDIICTMYPDVPRTVGLATRSDDSRPVILCEYSHAMGNCR